MTAHFLPRPISACVVDCAVYPILAGLLCLSASLAQADQLSVLNWNCWADGQDPVEISCIHERSLPLPRNAPEDTDIELENQLRDQLHEKIRDRNATAMEGVEWKNIGIQHKGAQWTIRIVAYPAGASLDENAVAKVAVGVLCPADIPCAVKVREPIP